MNVADEILELLESSGAPLSGEEMARQLGVSRNAVWKAVQRLREDEPTSFSNVTFQLDQQNKLFMEVSGISYANQIQRHVLEKDGLMYEYCYPYDAGTVLDTNPGDAVPMYYSIRKG